MSSIPALMATDQASFPSRHAEPAVWVAGVCLADDADVATAAATQWMPDVAQDDDKAIYDFSDPQVFGTYYDLLFHPLVRYVLALIRVDPAQAEDYVQTAFLKAWQCSDTFTAMHWRQFRSWVYKAVFHLVQAHIRSRQVAGHLVSIEVLRQQEDEGRLVPAGALVVPVSVEEQVEQREELAEVVQALAQMTPIERLSLHLDVQGYAPAEMAEQLRRGHAREGQIAQPVRYVALVRQRLRERLHRAKLHQRVVRRSYRKGVAKGAVNGWSAERSCCRQCQTTAYPYQGNGLCTRCYARQRHTWEGRGVCQQCGTTEHPYHGRGLCNRCAYQQRSATQRTQRQPRWAVRFDACMVCGTTAYAHQAHGKCKQCYGRAFRSWEGRGVCRQCGQTDSPHENQGICTRCAQRTRKPRRG